MKESKGAEGCFEMEMKRASLKLRQLKGLGGEGGVVPLIVKCMWFKNYPLMNSKTQSQMPREGSASPLGFNLCPRISTAGEIT